MWDRQKTFAIQPTVLALASSALFFMGAAAAIAGDKIEKTGCAVPTSRAEAPHAAGEDAGLRIRPATQRVEATPTAIAEAMARIKRNARQECAQWADKAFEEFERSTYKEPFDGGKYIVSGDIAIPDRQQLQEFFESHIKQQPPETETGGLIVHRVGGQNAFWSSTRKKQLTYCVSSSFGYRHQRVVADMEAATSAWEKAADVDFIHLATEDANCSASNPDVVFDIRPVNVHGQYLARAFFPNDQRAERNVLIDQSSFELDPNGALQLVGILRHEIGHTLGWRHEHTRPESGTCFEDNDWRPLTDYDRFSVMHYPQCNGGGDWSLTLTHMDRNGAACVYGAAPGFQVDPQICPNPPQTGQRVEAKRIAAHY